MDPPPHRRQPVSQTQPYSPIRQLTLAETSPPRRLLRAALSTCRHMPRPKLAPMREQWLRVPYLVALLVCLRPTMYKPRQELVNSPGWQAIKRFEDGEEEHPAGPAGN